MGFSWGGVLAIHDLFYNENLAPHVISFATFNSPIFGGLPFKDVEV